MQVGAAGRRRLRYRPTAAPAHRRCRASRACAGGIVAWVMIAGCSIRLSTPPRLSASAKMPHRFEEAPRTGQVGLQVERDHAAEAAASGAAPARAADATPGPDSARAPPSAAAPSQCASASALPQCRSMRSASVFTPRSARKLSNGPAIAPTAFCRKPRRSRHSAWRDSPADHRDAADHVGVAVQVLGRRVHDDVEAQLERPLHPRARERVVGDRERCRARGRSRRCAARSASFSSGLVGVSTHTIFVSGRIAARNVVEVRSGRRSVKSMPALRLRTRSNRRNVPP